jgi:hypothetical protein
MWKAWVLRIIMCRKFVLVVKRIVQLNQVWLPESATPYLLGPWKCGKHNGPDITWWYTTIYDYLEATCVSVRTPSSKPWEQTANNSESRNKLHMEQANLRILLIMVFLCCSNVHHTQRDLPTERLNPSLKLKMPYSFTRAAWMASCRSLQLPQAKKGA